MYFLQFSSVTSAVNNVYNLVTWKGSRKNLEWTCMDNIDHASRNRLSSSSMRRAAAASAWRNERTYNTHATNESFFVQENMAKQSDQQIQQSTRCRNKSRDLWRSLTISDGLWRSLTISDDLMGFIRTYGASSFSCATSWSFSESRDPAFQTRAQLDADLCYQCCDMLRPTLPSSTTAVNVFKLEMTQKWVSPLVTWWDSAMGFKQLALQYLESGSVKVWSARKNLLVHCGLAALKPASHR